MHVPQAPPEEEAAKGTQRDDAMMAAAERRAETATRGKQVADALKKRLIQDKLRRSRQKASEEYGNELDHDPPDGLTDKQREAEVDEEFAEPTPGTDWGQKRYDGNRS